jgi:hypothetical protein
MTRVLWFAIALGGCAAADDLRMDPPAAAADAGAARDGGRPEPADEDGLNAREGYTLDPSFADCFASGTLDCGALGCGQLASCCVGDGACGSRVEIAIPRELPIDSCESGVDAANCFSRTGLATPPFGLPPVMTEGGLSVPEGSLSADSGLDLGSVDLATHTISVIVQFDPASGCGRGCVDAIGVALYESSPATSTQPALALVYSAQRARVGLVAGGIEIQSFEVGAGPDTWVLRVLASGVVRVDRNGVPGAPIPLDLPSRASLAVVGRAGGTAADRAAIRMLQTDAILSDIPWAWGPASTVAVRSASVDWPHAIEAPSVVFDETGALIAFASRGDLFLARAGGADEYAAGEAIVGDNEEGEREWLRGGRADPELVRTSTGLELYFTARDLEARFGAIGHATIEGDEATVDGAPVLEPSALGLESVEAPTVAIHYTGERVMIARVRHANGRTSLEAFRQPVGDSFRPVASNLPAITTVEQQAALAFAADELGDPTLVAHDRVWKLFVTGRRGTRWTVGLLVSDDLVHWDWYGGGDPMFEGSRSSSDRLGVRSADIAATPTGLEMIYAGAVPGNARLSRATLVATDDARRLF